MRFLELLLLWPITQTLCLPVPNSLQLAPNPEADLYKEQVAPKGPEPDPFAEWAKGVAPWAAGAGVFGYAGGFKGAFNFLRSGRPKKQPVSKAKSPVAPVTPAKPAEPLTATEKLLQEHNEKSNEQLEDEFNDKELADLEKCIAGQVLKHSRQLVGTAGEQTLTPQSKFHKSWTEAGRKSDLEQIKVQTQGKYQMIKQDCIHQVARGRVERMHKDIKAERDAKRLAAGKETAKPASTPAKEPEKVPALSKQSLQFSSVTPKTQVNQVAPPNRLHQFADRLTNAFQRATGNSPAPYGGVRPPVRAPSVGGFAAAAAAS